MQFALDDDQRAFQELARKFLADRASSERTRAAMESARGWETELWTELVEEQGWTALGIPEDYGGFGVGHVTLAVMMEEAGRAMLCAPLFSTVAAANALIQGGSSEQKSQWLPAIAGGECLAAVAWSGATVQVLPDGDDVLLTGTRTHVIDGQTAELILVAATSEAAPYTCFYLVPAHAPGVTVTPVSTLDTTRRRATVRLDAVRLKPSARLSGCNISRPLNLARVMLAAEQLGGAEACLDMAVEYAKVREQFGRAIGSFQAIKHKCADMLLLVESARSAVWFAAWTAQSDPDNLPVAAAMAQAYCSEAFFKCAAENIQIHGGIGFTWEHDAHFYFKRARASADLLGNARQHRTLIAEHIGIGTT